MNNNDGKNMHQKVNDPTAKPKKFSVMMREMDFNAYRAYKMTRGDLQKAGGNPYALMRLNQNLMKRPFVLKDRRFRWQTNNLGEKQELKGTMKRKCESLNTSLNSNWEGLMSRTEDVPPKKSFGNKARNYKFFGNQISGRTVNPEIDFSCDEIYRKTSGLRSLDTYHKSTAVGSIGNLLDKTPEAIRLYKKFSGKQTEGNQIFTPDESGVKRRHKLSVNMADIKTNKEYAGVKSGRPDEKKINYAREEKIRSMQSDIFGKKSKKKESKEENKPLGVGRNDFKNLFKSSIVF